MHSFSVHNCMVYSDNVGFRVLVLATMATETKYVCH